jgi:CubicO group peptidase (beta-lactamase class C family)
VGHAVESIGKFVIEQLAAWEVPGCAIAAVHGGQVVLASGWGRRDLESELPVTGDTLFAIGSTTKAFTATMVGALVEDGLLEWDRPLRDYLPALRWPDPFVTERLTVTDLLSHRSGMPRHDLAWFGHPGLSRADIVGRLRFLPLSKGLREEFQYCNLGYLLAGHLVEAVCGVPWEDFVRSRLLTPLGMSRSNLSVEAMAADPDHATAYDRRQGAVVQVPARPVTALAPAGAINSCAADMARWLLAQLGGGQPDSAAVISPETLRRQHTPQVLVPEDRTFPDSTRHGYGLGWLIGRYRERRLAHHNGGIDGYLTECMLLPDDGIGVAVLTNSSSGAMAPVAAYRVLDELLGLEPIDWSARFRPRYEAALVGRGQAREARRVVPDAPRPRPLEAYAGEYRHPGYGSVVISAQAGALRPAFGTLKLTLAHRHFETFDLEWDELGDQPTVLPLMFLSNPDGDITALTVPFEPSVEPLRFDRQPDTPGPEVLLRLCGTYAMGPVDVVVARKGERGLTVSVPGSPPLELVPVRGLRFKVQGQPGIGLTAEFEVDADGAVTRLIAQPIGIFLPKGKQRGLPEVTRHRIMSPLFLDLALPLGNGEMSCRVLRRRLHPVAGRERARALGVARVSHWRSGWLKLSVNTSATAGFCDIAPSSWSRCGAGGSPIMRFVQSEMARTRLARRAATFWANRSSKSGSSAITAPSSHAEQEAELAPWPTTGSTTECASPSAIATRPFGKMA